MADVYLAAAEGPAGSGFTKLTVVKKLRDHLAEDPEFVAMLMDEARLTARLTHPNVVQLFEVGEVEGQYFLAMEYLEGQPLHRVERRMERNARHTHAKVPRDVYYAAISDVLAGLHYAHELADYDGTPLAVVHRDVTPHNVFVTYDGAVKVVDFGIAKAAGRSTETQHGIVKGKVRYMSPEQAAGGRIDRRTDIFAAGVMLWNLATGAKLWADRNDVDVARALYTGDYPASPRALHPDVPAEIDAICRKALAPRREDRYGTAAEMRADLEAFLGHGSADARKKTATLMKELFVAEREKVRGVLDASGLTSGTSIDELAAAIGMVTRPRAATLDPGSVSPMSVAPRPARAAAPRDADRARRQARQQSPDPAKTGPRALASAGRVIALALAAALAVCLAISWRDAARRVAAPAQASTRSVVVSELTASDEGVRSKLPRSESSSIAARTVASDARSLKSGRGVKAGAGKRLKAPQSASATAPAELSAPVVTPAPPSVPAVKESTQGSTRPRSAIDSADPWQAAPTKAPGTSD